MVAKGHAWAGRVSKRPARHQAAAPAIGLFSRGCCCWGTNYEPPHPNPCRTYTLKPRPPHLPVIVTLLCSAAWRSSWLSWRPRWALRGRHSVHGVTAPCR